MTEITLLCQQAAATVAASPLLPPPHVPVTALLPPSGHQLSSTATAGTAARAPTSEEVRAARAVVLQRQLRIFGVSGVGSGSAHPASAIVVPPPPPQHPPPGWCCNGSSLGDGLLFDSCICTYLFGYWRFIKHWKIAYAWFGSSRRSAWILCSVGLIWSDLLRDSEWPLPLVALSLPGRSLDTRYLTWPQLRLNFTQFMIPYNLKWFWKSPERQQLDGGSLGHEP